MVLIKPVIIVTVTVLAVVIAISVIITAIIISTVSQSCTFLSRHNVVTWATWHQIVLSLESLLMDISVRLATISGCTVLFLCNWLLGCLGFYIFSFFVFNSLKNTGCQHHMMLQFFFFLISLQLTFNLPVSKAVTFSRAARDSQNSQLSLFFRDCCKFDSFLLMFISSHQKFIMHFISQYHQWCHSTHALGLKLRCQFSLAELHDVVALLLIGEWVLFIFNTKNKYNAFIICFYSNCE